MSRRASRRLASHKIDIAAIAAADLADSDEDFPLAVDSDIRMRSPEGGNSSNEENDEEEEEEEEDADVVIGKKRKRAEDTGYDEDEEDADEEEDSESGEDDENEARGSEDEDDVEVISESKRRKRSPTPLSNDEGDDDVIELKQKKKAKVPAPRVITYTVNFLASLDRSKKIPATRTPIQTLIISLGDDEPFDTLKAQILVRVDNVYNPPTLDFDDYDITFTIPRIVTDAITLDAGTYNHLLKKASKMDDPAARIRIDPKKYYAPEKPNKENTEELVTGRAGKGKKRTEVPKEDRILPANAALNEKIGILRARWACSHPGGPCGSDFCYIKPDGEEHFPLGHDHFNVWAAAWLKGPNFADENKPPNDKLFDGIHPGALGARAPLLQRRLDLQNQRNTPVQPPMPQITINMPDMVQRYQPAAALPAPPVPGPAYTGPAMLIPAHLVPDKKLTIEEFCKTYELDDEIAARFRENKYKTTDAFVYVEVQELREVGFVAGEIAQLKAGIAEWCKV
ncbi:hypothetical protein B0H16DRAFT_1890211 [Mycena metata]|uniref:Uncharacterized protein n=1 Tax=Mycena metata TaxID=1033252 RepID=A0AAD7N2E3_9AGAR|nr:hypothetical protein B0H16DRAFT_1890211 [Mycena metata]